MNRAVTASGGRVRVELNRVNSWVELNLDETQVSDAGCAALAAALDSGALPALDDLTLDDTPARDRKSTRLNSSHT